MMMQLLKYQRNFTKGRRRYLLRSAKKPPEVPGNIAVIHKCAEYLPHRNGHDVDDNSGDGDDLITYRIHRTALAG